MLLAIQVSQSQQMSRGEIPDVYVVAHAGPIRRWDNRCHRFPHLAACPGRPANQRYKVTLRMVASPRSAEAPAALKYRNAACLIPWMLIVPVKDALKNQFGFTIGVGGILRMVLCEDIGFRITIDGGGG